MRGALMIATWLLHYVAPVPLPRMVGAVCPQHGTLRFRHIALMLLPGIGYVAWVLLRGAVVGEYPYEEFLDARKLGYAGVAAGVGVLLLAVSIFSVIIVWSDRWLGRRRALSA